MVVKEGFRVYGRDGCPYSRVAAKQAGVPVTPVAEMEDYEKQASAGHTTVPKVFRDGQFIGGQEELEQLLKPNKPDKCIRRTKECHNSCFTTEELRLIARQYNAAHPGKPPVSDSAPRKKLYDALKRRIHACNDSEKCWIQQAFAAPLRKRMLTVFVPKMPEVWKSKPTTWLTNHDIDAVLRRYEAHHPKFRFLGVQFMDFRGKKRNGECVSDLCDFKVDDYFPKYNKVAAVFNLDKHNQSGSHWVGLMLCLSPSDKRYGVYYYDSVARVPTPEMNEFVNEIVAQQVAQGRPVPRYEYNNLQHQKKNTECGMFSIFFIDRIINTPLAFSGVCKLMGDDEKMLALRKEFFQS